MMIFPKKELGTNDVRRFKNRLWLDLTNVYQCPKFTVSKKKVSIKLKSAKGMKSWNNIWIPQKFAKENVPTKNVCWFFLQNSCQGKNMFQPKFSAENFVLLKTLQYYLKDHSN